MSETDAVSERAFHAIVDAETIQTTVSLVDALVDECTIELDDDGIRITAVDPASVALVDVEVETDGFEAYETGGGRIGVDAGRLRDVVGMADRNQSVEFALDPETRKLEISIDELEYTLALIDPETIRSPPDISEMDAGFTGGVVIDADAIDRALRAADMVSNHVTFGIDEDESIFSVEAAGDTDDISFSLTEADLIEFAPGDARSLFSLDYLNAVNRAISGTPEVDLRFGTETPIRIHYEFADGTGTVEYVVSPRRTVDY